MNLDTLHTEIQQYLEESGLAIFHGQSRDHSPVTVYWDCEQYPDYKLFIQTAQAAGVKFIVFHQHRLAFAEVAGALAQLQDSDFTREEQREYKRRLNALRIHDGQVGAIELSFDHQGSVFLFNLRTEWHDEISSIFQEIDFMSPGSDEDDEPMGGYFSKN